MRRLHFIKIITCAIFALGLGLPTVTQAQVGLCGNCSLTESGEQPACVAGSVCTSWQSLVPERWTDVTGNLTSTIGTGKLLGWDLFITSDNQQLLHMIVDDPNSESNRIYYKKGSGIWNSILLGPGIVASDINLHQLSNASIQISLSNPNKRLSSTGQANSNLLLTREISPNILQSETYLGQIYSSNSDQWTDSSAVVSGPTSLSDFPEGDYFLNFSQGYDHLGNTRQHVITYKYTNTANTKVLTYLYRRYGWKNGGWSSWRFVAATDNETRLVRMNDLSTEQGLHAGSQQSMPEGALTQLDFKYFNSKPYYYMMKQQMSATNPGSSRLVFYGLLNGTPAELEAPFENSGPASYCSPEYGNTYCKASNGTDTDGDAIPNIHDLCDDAWGPSFDGCPEGYVPPPTSTPPTLPTAEPSPTADIPALVQPSQFSAQALCTANRAGLTWKMPESFSLGDIEGLRIEYCKKNSATQTTCTSPYQLQIYRTKLIPVGVPANGLLQWRIFNEWQPTLYSGDVDDAVTLNIFKGDSALVRVRTYQGSQVSEPTAYTTIKHSGPEGDINNDCTVNVTDYTSATNTSMWNKASNNTILFLLNKLIRFFGTSS